MIVQRAALYSSHLSTIEDKTCSTLFHLISFSSYYLLTKGLLQRRDKVVPDYLYTGDRECSDGQIFCLQVRHRSTKVNESMNKWLDA